VKHYLYCSSENTEGLDEYVAFLEIAEDGYCSRYLELRPMGALRYTEDKPADEYGALPEGPWDELEAAKPKYGTLNDISKELFDSAWNTIQASSSPAWGGFGPCDGLRFFGPGKLLC
jgi:hypothetical protein